MLFGDPITTVSRFALRPVEMTAPRWRVFCGRCAAAAVVVFVVGRTRIVGKSETGWNHPVDDVWRNDVGEREGVVRHVDEEEAARRNGNEERDLNAAHTVSQARTRVVMLRALPHEDWHMRDAMRFHVVADMTVSTATVTSTTTNCTTTMIVAVSVGAAARLLVAQSVLRVPVYVRLERWWGIMMQLMVRRCRLSSATGRRRGGGGEVEGG